MYGETELKNDIQNAFGELNGRQLWVLVNLAKRVRLRARNNSAFNNLFNRLFTNARFRQVPKVSKAGRHYEGLEITIKGEPQLNSHDEDEE